jgi:hypothetical protein
MPAWRVASFACAGALSAAVLSAGGADPDLEDPGVVASASRRASLESASGGRAALAGGAGGGPTLHPRLPERVTARLERAIPVAKERLREYASCEALFTRLGADGEATLDGASYYPAGPRQERKYCRDGSFALTTVGGSAVVLCRSFSRLNDHDAAIILLHEALHLAGQTEYPSDTRAPDTLRITEMVMEGCRLF